MERQTGSGGDAVPGGAAVDIEKEAAYVDEEILEVGNFMECLQRYAGNFSPHYWSSLDNTLFRKQICNLLTPGDRVDFAWKYFIGRRVPPDVLNSKLWKFNQLLSTVFLVVSIPNNSYVF